MPLINHKSLLINASIEKTPFQYSKIKNFFDKDLFKKINHKISNALEEEKTRESFLNEFQNLKNSSSNSKPASLPLFKERWKELGIDENIHDEIDSSIKKIRKELFKHYGQTRFGRKYYNQILFGITPPEYEFGTHSDSASKTWTLVIYLYPEVNDGTYLYDDSKENQLMCEWGLNEGIAFCPKNNSSFHSYKNSSSDKFRVTLIINIIRVGYGNLQNEIFCLPKKIIFFFQKNLFPKFFKNTLAN